MNGIGWGYTPSGRKPPCWCPLWASNARPNEARKLPWPPQAEELGAAVLELLDELKQNRIQYNPEAKGYWFQPGIRSWKAFQAASSTVDVELRGTELSITRWDGRSERGFVPELEPCTVLQEGVGPKELGEKKHE